MLRDRTRPAIDPPEMHPVLMAACISGKCKKTTCLGRVKEL